MGAVRCPQVPQMARRTTLHQHEPVPCQVVRFLSCLHLVVSVVVGWPAFTFGLLRFQVLQDEHVGLVACGL